VCGLHLGVIAVTAGSLYFTSQSFQDTQNAAFEHFRIVQKDELESYRVAQEGKVFAITARMDQFEEQIIANSGRIVALQEENNQKFSSLTQEIKNLGDVFKFSAWTQPVSKESMGPGTYYEYLFPYGQSHE